MKEIQIYVIKDNSKRGPFTHEQIQAMLASSEISLNDNAWAEGHDNWKPLHLILGGSVPAQSLKSVANPAGTPSSSKPAYLYISTGRLIFMTVISLGVFSSYWVYKNWRYIKERDDLDIMPFWRGWFAFFHFHSLLKYIKEDPKLSHTERPDYSSGWLTFGFIAFTLCGNQIIIPSMLTFLFILPAHNYITKINEAAPNRPAYSPWSFGQILCAAFVPALFFIVILITALSSR
jgi:hypothetical protein